jgi:hypothetical protein
MATGLASVKISHLVVELLLNHNAASLSGVAAVTIARYLDESVRPSKVGCAPRQDHSAANLICSVLGVETSFRRHRSNKLAGSPDLQ